MVDKLLSVENLKTYFPTDEGVVKAVDGVTFDIEPGKTLGIVGESGCGKSTVGRSLLQIIDHPGKIIEGQVHFQSESAGGLVDLAQEKPGSALMRQVRGGEIALVFQEPMTSFSPVHTVGNQVVEAIQLHMDVSKKIAMARAEELFDLVGIPNPRSRLNEYAYQLSGGLRQRAMIAMALSADPKLLIADEPTTALDVTTQAQILELLKTLQKQNNMAILMITHNLGVIAEMADDVVVMYLGKGVEECNIDDIFHDPQHPYTQGLLKSIPSIYTEGEGRLPSIKGTIPHPFNRPSGCTFRTRCPDYIQGECNTAIPQLQTIGNTKRTVSCFKVHPRKEEVAANG